MTHPWPPPRRTPFWLELALVVLVGLSARALNRHADAGAHVQLAIFPVLVFIAEAIWAGLQAVEHVTVIALHYIVIGLNWFVHTLYNGIVDVGRTVWRGFVKAWELVGKLYEEVLKPAWQKFWRFVDWARDTLDRVFKPVLKVLNTIRAHVLAYWNSYVKPVLDTIAIARKALRLLAALGLDWARALDAKLAVLEEKINAPFVWLLARVNEVINLVNRVVTADGLFQRLALIRSIERDIAYVHREFLHAWHHPLTDADRTTIALVNAPKLMPAMVSDARDYLESGGGADAALITEVVAEVRIALRAA